uniref:Uncharacterized protein n=1 Tax=Tanacetum cinerariifolium TaxID=118510 RepID=A0A699HKZ2_TANCI|nr:hypothetical protein [Tanacetum cinerariifolium]
MKLKERIKSLSGNLKEEKVKRELEEIETINIELDHKVTKLVAKNEHLKQTYKQLYDSIKSSLFRKRFCTALKDTLSKLKGKAVINEAVTLHPIDPELKDLQHSFHDFDVCCYVQEKCGYGVLMSQPHNMAMLYNKDGQKMHTVSKPLPLGGPPGQVTIQSDFFFNKDLEYLRYGSKGRRPALSISKMKAAYYPDDGLEQMVPDQFWIDEECKYDIAVMYGISHWWFQRQRFYIDRHTSKGDRSAVRTHIRILSVVRIKVFSMYGYDYMKKIVLRHADLNEHVIAERDFKYMYPSDFKDMYLLNLQGHLNHLSPKDKKILTTAVNQ